MPKYVLNYFDLKGRGESIRLLLAYGEEDWEDKRIQAAEWPKLKPETPFGQLPVLEVDGKKFAQGLPLTRWLGRKYGLAGKDADEDLIIDQNVEFYNDIVTKSVTAHYESDPELKEKKHEIYSKDVYPIMLKRLDQMIKDNGGYIALGRLTWADFYFVGIFDNLKIMLRIPDLEKQYPSFEKIYNEVLSIPAVKTYNDAAYPA